MICNYSTIVASKLGINSALIAGYIKYRLTKTTSFVGDSPCVRLTQRQMTATFPFMGEKAVRNAVNRLVRENILVKKQYNKSKYDHAYFYTLTTYGKTVLDEGVDYE